MRVVLLNTEIYLGKIYSQAYKNLIWIICKLIYLNNFRVFR